MHTTVTFVFGLGGDDEFATCWEYFSRMIMAIVKADEILGSTVSILTSLFYTGPFLSQSTDTSRAHSLVFGTGNSYEDLQRA